MAGRKTRTLLLTLAALSVSLSGEAIAVERLTITPEGRASLQGTRTYSGVVMSAYQKVYAMNFEIWKPSDLPAGWYATFDGFPVAQIAENRWVYGQFALDGAIVPTNVLVGSVVPSSVPGLARIAAVWSYGRAINSPEFQKIREHNCNRMGWINDNYISTVIAWRTSQPGLWVWLGNRWKKFTPSSGGSAGYVLHRNRIFIFNELRKNNVMFGNGEPMEIADLARQWGCIWVGRVKIGPLRNPTGNGGEGTRGGGTTSMPSTPSSDGGNGGNGGDSGPQWDVD